MIEPKYPVGARVIVTADRDTFTGRHATVRSWKRKNSPRRIAYVLDIDGETMKYGAGPYGESELKEESKLKITQITVSYGETQSLPEYSNVKPNLTLTAVLDEGDLPEEIETLLWQTAKASVHAQIDDALEANGRPAKYSTDPRYQVLRTYWNHWEHRGEQKPPQYVIIAPDEIKLDRGAYAQRLIIDSSKLRLARAQKAAAELLGDTDEHYTLLDCSSGDLTPLNLALSAPERPFDEDDARAQEHTSPEYQAAMGPDDEGPDNSL